jgi:hypothetical protein
MDLPRMSGCWGLSEGDGGLDAFAFTRKRKENMSLDFISERTILNYLTLINIL